MDLEVEGKPLKRPCALVVFWVGRGSIVTRKVVGVHLRKRTTTGSDSDFPKCRNISFTRNSDVNSSVIPPKKKKKTPYFIFNVIYMKAGYFLRQHKLIILI